MLQDGALNLLSTKNLSNKKNSPVLFSDLKAITGIHFLASDELWLVCPYLHDIFRDTVNSILAESVLSCR